MYETVFHFNSRPFTTTPYVKHYFAADSIHNSLGQARLCIDRGTGPVIVVGAVGTGKSLLLAMLEEQYQSQFNVINLACARLGNREDFLKTVLFELSLPFKAMTESESRLALVDYLKPSDQCPNGVLLLVDEAHTLSGELLDEIRLVTNYVREGQPRVRLVMAGTQRLEDNLTDPKLESFNQRIAARCYLEKMSRDETSRYVIEHIERAGGKGEQLFNVASLKTIHEVSEGCPRLVNQVCDHSLILAGTRGEFVVTENLIREAWADVQSIPGGWAPPAEQPATTSNLEDDDSWTVIEFGSLDDEESAESTSTTSSIANEQPSEPSDADESVTVYDFSNAADSESSNVNEMTSTPVSIAGESNDDEASLDAVEDLGAGLDNESDSDNEADVNVLGWEASQDSSDVQETEHGNSRIGEEDGPSGNTSELTPDLPVLAKENSTLEDEFNAVFGIGGNADTEASSTENELTEEGEARAIEELESDQESLLDQVEADITAGDVAGAVAIGAAVIGLANSPEDTTDSTANEFDSSELESVGGDSSLADEPIETSPEEVARTVSETFVMDSAASSLDETSKKSDHEEALQNESEPQDEQPVSDSVPRVPQETVDPFDEPFADEELLKDRFAPFVAHQNKSALEITSDQLDSIVPVDERSWGETEVTNDSLSDHANTEQVADGQAEPEPPRWGDASAYALEADASAEVEDCSLESETPNSVGETPTVSNDGFGNFVDSPGVFVIGQESSESQPTVEFDVEQPSSDAREVSSTIEMPVEPTVQPFLNPFPDSTSLTRPVAPTIASDSNEGITAGHDVGTEEQPQEFHDHISAIESNDIQRQAEEILKRLNVSGSVSHETSQEQNNLELDSSSPQREIPMTMPMVDLSQPGETDLAKGSTSHKIEDDTDSGEDEFSKQKSALDESQKILNEILAQKNILADQHRETSNRSVPPTMQIEYPMEPSGHQEAGESKDDSEMIIISRMEQEAAPPKKEEEIQFPSTPISTGRAERMDYQKLFDQLRDISSD